MKSRRWIAAAALAAAVVFLVMITGEHGPAAPDATPAPVSSSGAVLASDGGPPDDDGEDGGGAEGADRDEVIDAVQGLLDALGISAEELADGAGCGGQAQSGSESGNNNGNNNGGSNGNGNGEAKGEAKGEDCEQSEPAATGRSGSATITIAAFAFGQPLTVAPGATVEVVNSDAAPHNVTAADGSFETPDLDKDDTATFTAPTKAGRYEFTCTLHPEMTGTLIIEGASGGGQGRARSSEPTTGSQQGGAGASDDDHDSSRQQRGTMAPGRTGGSSDGY